MSSSSTRLNERVVIRRPITPGEIRKLNTQARFRWFIETCSICPSMPGGDPYLRAVIARLGRLRLSCDLWPRFS